METNVRLCFLNFTPPNLAAVLPRVRRESELGHEIEFVFGYDYDAEPPPAHWPRLMGVRWSHLLRDWGNDTARPDRPPCFDRLAAVLTGARFPAAVKAAVEATLRERYDWSVIDRAVVQAEAAIRNLFETRRPDLLILPEQTDYVRGAPAARLARESGIPFEVSLPRYYNAMVSYPVRSQSAHCEWEKSGLFSAGPLQPKIVFALQGLAWERLILNDLVEILAERPSFTLVIRPHPRSPNAELEKWAAQFPRVKIDRRPQFDFAAFSPALFLAQTSTLLDEAKRYGVNCRSVQYSGFPAELYSTEAAIEDRAQLRAAIAFLPEGTGSCVT